MCPGGQGLTQTITLHLWSHLTSDLAPATQAPVTHLHREQAAQIQLELYFIENVKCKIFKRTF